MTRINKSWTLVTTRRHKSVGRRDGGSPSHCPGVHGASPCRQEAGATQRATSGPFAALRGRNLVPEHVAICPTHGPRQRIGEDRVETLEFQRPKLRVRVTIIPKFACDQAAACGIKTPERSVGLVEGNRYDTSVAAEILTAKYGYHLPVYRQQDIFAGSGWVPSRSTLLNIMESAAGVLQPMYDHYAAWSCKVRCWAPTTPR